MPARIQNNLVIFTIKMKLHKDEELNTVNISSFQFFVWKSLLAYWKQGGSGYVGSLKLGGKALDVLDFFCTSLHLVYRLPKAGFGVVYQVTTINHVLLAADLLLSH